MANNLEIKDTKLDFGYGFAWGLTLHQELVHLEKHDLRAGVSVNYSDYQAKNEKAETDAEEDIKPESSEWNIFASVAKDFGQFSVHGGVKYTEMDMKIKDFVPKEETVDEDAETLVDLQFDQEDEVSVVVGATYEATEKLVISGEAQFMNGETLILRAFYRY